MTDLATNPEAEVRVDPELLEEAQRQISATVNRFVPELQERRISAGPD